MNLSNYKPLILPPENLISFRKKYFLHYYPNQSFYFPNKLYVFIVISTNSKLSLFMTNRLLLFIKTYLIYIKIYKKMFLFKFYSFITVTLHYIVPSTSYLSFAYFKAAPYISDSLPDHFSSCISGPNDT